MPFRKCTKSLDNPMMSNLAIFYNEGIKKTYIWFLGARRA